MSTRSIAEGKIIEYLWQRVDIHHEYLTDLCRVFAKKGFGRRPMKFPSDVIFFS